MKLGVIRGHITATVKHPSFEGCRMLIAELVDDKGAPDGAPQVVVDPIGAGMHQTVILCSDGGYARTIVDDPKSPARWWVMGIVDPERSLAV